jgi:hypothetical protein
MYFPEHNGDCMEAWAHDDHDTDQVINIWYLHWTTSTL